MRLRCTLPNASGLISGVRFTPDGQGSMVSESMADDQARRWAGIPGYQIMDENPAPPASKPRRVAAQGADT